MTIKLRFALLLSLLLGGFVIAMLILHALERSETEAMVASDHQARSQLLNHWLDFTSRSLPQFVADTAQAEELAAMLDTPGSNVTRETFTANIAAAGLSSVWVLRGNGSIALQIEGREGGSRSFPIEPAEFVELVTETPSPRFFAEQDHALIEVCIRRIQPVRADGLEWLAAGRRWDDAQLSALRQLTESDVQLRPVHEIVASPQTDGKIVLLRPLLDWRGHPLRTLQVKAASREIANALEGGRRQSRIFLVFALLLMAALALALHRWVLEPLKKITKSLAADNPQIVAALSKDVSELGQVAKLIEISFTQRHQLELEITHRKTAQEALEQSEAALRSNLAEREQLGRDLHDGIIQSLYAAGMGLAGIRVLLKSDQAEAAARLEETRTALNETIHDVRNFIIGLEPESLKRQTFGQAVMALMEMMRRMRPFQSTVTIDEEIASCLTLAQRVHALQITREAVSNALRHGAADNIGVVLRWQGELVAFEVVDDGSGFEAGSSHSAGKGLANFAQRANELGAELQVNSKPGRTQVRLLFALLIA